MIRSNKIVYVDAILQGNHAPGAVLAQDVGLDKGQPDEGGRRFAANSGPTPRRTGWGGGEQGQNDKQASAVHDVICYRLWLAISLPDLGQAMGMARIRSET